MNGGVPAPQTFEVVSDPRLVGGWRYELPGQASCGATKLPSGHTVMTQAAAELPTSIGTVSAEPNATNGTNLRIQPSPELAAYEPIAALRRRRRS